jgi:hypothetical protein
MSNDESRNKQFKIERSTNSNNHLMNDTINIKTENNVNIERPNEHIRLSNVKKTEKVDPKPHLTTDNLQNNVPKPKLVPMEGLDLLSNPKKTYESSANNTDSDIQQFSSDSSDDNKISGSYENLFNNTPMSDDKDSEDGEYYRYADNKHSDSKHSDSKHSDSDDDYRRKHNSDSLSISSASDRDEIKQQKTYEELQREKQFLLFKLERLEKSMKIKLSRRYTMASNIDDIQHEYDKLKRERDIDKSIKFQRKALMAITSGLEFLNNKFDPIDAKLDGWSESVMENIDDYDEVFEELHDKYAEKIEVAPELKLMMMVGGSAFMFHMTNTLFKSNMPSLNEVLRQNPDIMRNISEAAVKSMGNNMGGDEDFTNMMKQSVNMKSQQYEKSAQNSRSSGSGGGNMRGPTNVDDLISDAQSSDSDSAQHSAQHNVQRNVSYNAKKQRRPRKSDNRGININV